jgi:hypothetical protein
VPRETAPLAFSEIAAMLKEFWASLKRVPSYAWWVVGTLLVCGIIVYSL